MPAGTSLDTIQRIIDAAVAYTVSRMRVLERLPGNPIGIGYRTIDHITALMAKHLPSPSFNRVVGLRAGDERHLAPLVAWYRDNSGAGRFEMIPGHFDAALGGELARLGYHHSGFHSALICDADAPAATSGGIAIEPVTGAALMEDFLQAYVAGWGVPQSAHQQFKANVRPWLGQPGWSLYLGRHDGRPAAAAAFYLRDKTCYLADATTDPAFRGRGLHTALLARRITDARAAGADLVFSGAAFLSDSYRNMERLGMRLAFMRAIWTPVETTL